MKKILSIAIALLMCFSLAACGGDEPEEAAQPPDLSGEWVQTNSGSEDTYHAAYISDDSIEIYWVMESDDMTALYWAGSYKAPVTADEPYIWSSENDTVKTDMAFLASGDTTKDFSYENGVISYTASAMGESMTVKLEREPWGYENLELSLGGGGEISVGSGSVGPNYIEIKNAVISEDYEGNPAIVVFCDWTNNSEETTSAMFSLIGQAFQSGVELESAIIDGDDNNMKDIRPGTTIEIQFAFVLSDTSSSVEFEISEFLGFSGSMVTMEFDPSGL